MGKAENFGYQVRRKQDSLEVPKICRHSRDNVLTYSSKNHATSDVIGDFIHSIWDQVSESVIGDCIPSLTNLSAVHKGSTSHRPQSSMCLEYNVH